MQPPMICSALFSSIFPLGAWRDWSYTALLWRQTVITGSSWVPLAISHLIQCHIPALLTAVLQHEVIGQYELIPFMTRWPQSSLTVVYFWMSKRSAFLPPPPLFLCLYFWLNHQITVCLPSQVTVSAVSGWRATWSFPKVCQLLFSASGDKHQRIHKVKNSADTNGGFLLLSFSNFQANMSRG